ncbi:MATE family efflux transporter [Vibrio vulnificus]|uniref:MATE family efflux transporter n=1 Tax=Vibrio vulnificus TaxID=672 RepID=UPI00165D3154|nr:MATE family efflux transporter [Vibrio vulnificus]
MNDALVRQLPATGKESESGLSSKVTSKRSPNMLRLLRSRQSRSQLYLALPLMLQAVLTSLTGFVDNLMVGQLGEQVLSAIGNGFQLLAFGSLLLAALSMGAGALMAQHFGAGQKEQLGRTLSTLALTALIGGTILAGAFIIGGEWLAALITLELFNPPTPDVAVAPLAGTYLGIIGWAIPLWVMQHVLAAAFHATGDTKTPVKVFLIFNILNAMGNWVLIFGGAIPQLTEPFLQPLGYQGAAISTAICFAGGGLTMIFLSLRKHQPWAGQLTRPTVNILKDLLAIGLPMSVDGFIWQAAQLFYAVVMNAIGAQAFAAFIIIKTFKGLALLPANGIQQATAIFTGQLLGAGSMARARMSARTGLLLGVVVMLLPATLLALGSGYVLNLYQIAPETHQLAQICLWIASASLTAFAINSVVAGVLRAGGDTSSMMYITLGCFLFIGAPASYLLGIVFDGGLIGAFVGLTLEEVAKAMVMQWRMRKGYWLKKLI